jgi:hypothetical protein
MALFRIAVVGDFDPAAAPKGLANAVHRMTGTPDLAALEQQLSDSQRDVHALFRNIIDTAAVGSEPA